MRRTHRYQSEDFFFSQITHAKPSTEPLGNREREAAILAHGADITKTFDSIDVAKPAGSFSNLTEADGGGATLSFEAANILSGSWKHATKTSVRCRSHIRSLARSTAMKPYY
jgi:hypothetical protein